MVWLEVQRIVCDTQRLSCEDAGRAQWQMSTDVMLESVNDSEISASLSLTSDLSNNKCL